jgi:NAD(P)-dependent dehydrogenase (short-subunit alcohol dehydrogenase family)
MDTTTARGHETADRERRRGFEFDLDGKVAVVTGGAGGIGLEAARGLARYGADVVLLDVQAGPLPGAAADIAAAWPVRTSFRTVDITRKDQIDAAAASVAEEFGQVDILVNSAGINIPQIAEEVTEAAWDKVIDINLKGSFFCCQAFGKLMIPRQQGKIVNISSQAGSVGLIRRCAYCASKGGMDQLTRVLAVEWARHNINVNSLAPTFLLTPLTEAMFTEKEFKDYVDANILLSRLATTDDLIGAVVFLSSRASDMVTGTVLYVDGGWTAH